MPIEVKVPILPESVADATVAIWHKQPGDKVKRNENLVDIETDKVMLEVPAPEDGVLEAIVKADGSTVTAEEVIALIIPQTMSEEPARSVEPLASAALEEDSSSLVGTSANFSPAVRRLLDEHQLDAANIPPTGKSGRLTKQDVIQFLDKKSSSAQPAKIVQPLESIEGRQEDGRLEKRVPMTRLRKRLATRLVGAQQTAAILTTFNEVDLKPIMEIRKRYKDQFNETHGVKLGFMSFFLKAAVEALKRFPAVNASIDGDDIVYHGFFDIGVAVSTERGLVVPVIRDVDKMSLARIEMAVNDFGLKARNNQLTVEDLTGGTFTVSNGGVFGSLLSTPILNPPQSAILGMHKIQERPVVIDGEIVVRPMMYLALSYDHRMIDGRESVTFLATIKSLLEDPTRLLLDL